jgi:hypothetical protein
LLAFSAALEPADEHALNAILTAIYCTNKSTLFPAHHQAIHRVAQWPAIGKSDLPAHWSS